MLVALSCNDKDLESELEIHFGRAAHFLIFDTETKLFSICDNPAQNASIGVGIAAAEALIDLKVEAVVTGQIGPNVLLLFSDAHIHMYQGISGTIRENIKAFRKHRLSVIKQSGPDHAPLRGL